jgi:hypothetical protein
MTHFAIRQQVGRSTIEDLEGIAGTESHARCRFVEAYWTPEQQQLLSIYEGDGLAVTIDRGPLREMLAVLPIRAEEYGPPAMEPAAAEGDGLQLVLVRRHLESMTSQEFRAIALRAIMCAYEYRDLRWLRSYWATEQNELLCLFRTRTHELVREHALRSRIPCDEVHDAIQVGPGVLARA